MAEKTSLPMGKDRAPYQPGKAPLSINDLSEASKPPIEDVSSEYYVVKDNSGKRSTKTENQLTSTERAALANGGVADGGRTDWQNNPGKYASISLNKSTGKITVNAPDSVLRSSAVKENYVTALKTISRMYKADSKQKFALLQNNDETKTAEDWVKDIEKDFKNDVPRIIAQENIKAEHLEKAGVKLSDEDLTKMRTAAVEYNDENGNIVKVSKNTLQVIPDSLMVLPAFKNLSGRDAKSHTVKWKDLSEVWNRDNTSDEDILEVYKAVERYFDRKDFSDPTEYAEMTAMATFLRQQDPSVNFWRGTGEVLGNIIAGTLSGAATFDVGVGSAIEGVVDWVSNVAESSARSIFGKEDWGEAWEKSKGNDITFVRDFLAPELETWANQHHENMMNLNEPAAAGFTITNKLTPIGMQLATVVAAGNAASAYAETTIGRVVTSIAAKYGETASSLATVTVSNIASGAVTFEEISKGLYAGTEIMLTLSDAATAAATAAKAIAAVRSVSYAAGAIAKMSDIAAQVVVDVTLTNPKLFRQLLETDDEDAKAYAMEQLSQNVVGEVGGIAIGKAIAGFSKTDLGRVVNVKASGAINSLKANVGEMADRLKINILHGGNENWLIDKRDKLAKIADKDAGTWLANISSNRASRAERQLQNYTERLILRRAAEMSAESAAKVGGRSWEEIIESAKTAQKEMRLTTAKANNLVNLMYKSDVTAEAAKIVADDSVLFAARGAYLDSLSRVVSAENADGLGKALRRIKTESGGIVRVLSKETNEYVNALYRERIALAEIDLSDVAENIKGAQEELPRLREIISDFEGSHSQELVQAAQELEKKGRDFSAAVQDARVHLGVMSEDTLNGLRASGFFDDGYMRQQRIKNWANYKKRGGQLRISEVRDIHQKLGWGSTGDWQDISIVLFDDLNETSRQVVRKRMTETLDYLGFKMDVVVNEDGTRIVEEISPIREKVVGTINKNANTFVKNMDDSVLHDIYDYNKKSTALRNQQVTTISSGANVAKTKASVPSVTRRERHKFFQTIDESLLDDYLLSADDNPFTIQITDKDSALRFRDSLDPNSQRMLDDSLSAGLGDWYNLPTRQIDVPKVSADERAEFLYRMPEGGLDSLVLSDPRSAFNLPITNDDELWNFRKKLDYKSRKMLDDKVKQGLGRLYDLPVPSRRSRLAGGDLATTRIRQDILQLGTTKMKPSELKSLYTMRNFERIIEDDPSIINDIKRSYVDTKFKGIYDLAISDAKEAVDTAARQTEVLSGVRELNREEISRLYEPEFVEQVLRSDPTLVSNMKRSYAESELGDMFDGRISDLKRAELVKDAEFVYGENVRKLKKWTEQYNLPDAEQAILKSVDDLIDVSIDNNMADEKTARAFKSLSDANTSADDIAEYVSTKSLVDNKKKLRKQFIDNAKKRFNESATADINLKYARDPKGRDEAAKRINKIADKYAKDAADLFEERLMQKYNEVSGRLAAQGSDIIDKNDYFAKVDVLNKEIAGAAKNPNVVKTYGAHGREEYVEMSPTIASMFTNMPRPIRRGPFGVIQSAFVRTFRFGTTGGHIPGSLVNQAFRDTGNAIIAGDAWNTSTTVKRILSDEFGDTVADYMQKEMPDVWETLLEKANGSESGAVRLAVEREAAIGAMNVEPQLERNIYQLGREARIRRNAEGVYDASTWDKITDALDAAQAKLETPNAIRETYLRNRVYNNNFLEGLRTGMSINEAREFAQFMQSEATTNFVRQSYHLANLTQTVPYLGAAINGAKSFWRLYSLDPVGITTRIVGGYVVPIIALTANSLKNEEDRRIYEQIPEYEKRDHLTFVIDKQIISIPIPQEMSNFVTPVQHMVEKMYKANDNSFAELMANDLLGSFPIDLSGFINIDSDKILKDNLVEDHLLPGFSRIASSLMPPLIKSGFMWWTGIDPYTGRKINTADQGVDPETGERIVYDYKTGALARAIGKKTGDLMSAQMAQKVLQTLFGTGGMTFIDSFGEVVDAALDDDEGTTVATGLLKGGQKIVENATSRVIVDRYGEESVLAWNRAVRELEARRAKLVNDKSYKEDVEALARKDLSEDARKKIESRVRTRRQEYMQQVLDATNNLINRYGGTFDKYKLTTVISLMNLEEDVTNESPYDKYASYLSDEDKDLNKAIAIETMVNMGFPSTNDMSLFGYYYTDPNTGKVTIKYNSPLSILNYNRNRRQQQNIDAAQVNSILEENNITRGEMFGDTYQKIKASGNKAALKEYKSEWNKKVVKALAPYIQSRGVNSFINTHSNQTLLKDYIFISNPYKEKEYLLKIFGGK